MSEPLCLFVCFKVDTKFLIHLSCNLCSKLHTILHSVHQQVSEEADNIVPVSEDVVEYGTLCNNARLAQI